jgi:Protein of unknown function (DUF1559)
VSTEVAAFAVWSVLLLVPAVARVSDAGLRGVVQHRHKEIGLAMHHYADDHGGQLPPAAVYGPDDRPLLSWQVLLLPYLGQEDLYRQFQQDEPWDSPHNLTLLARMPEVYAPPAVPGLRAEPSATFDQAFVGQGAAFEGHEGLRLPDARPTPSWPR